MVNSHQYAVQQRPIAGPITPSVSRQAHPMAETNRDSNPANLLSRARSGDRVALGNLLEGYRSRLGDQADVEFDERIRGRVSPNDLVQQTLLEACRDFERFTGADERVLAAWLESILRHNIKEAVRKHVLAAKRSTKVETSIDDSARSPKLAQLLPGKELTPSGHFRKNETKDRVTTALAALNDDQRLAVWLKHIEGWSLYQIAQQMDRSEEAVAGLLKRGLKQLMRLLRDEGQ